MRLLTLFFPFLAAAIPLSFTTRPASPPQPQPHQKALALPAQLSPATSFSTTSTTSSTSNKPPTLASKLSSLFTHPKPPTGDFKCHRYPRTAILPTLSAYITTLLRSYRESIFGKERMLFETCYAGYEADDAHPSIYFGNLAKKQSVAVEKLVRNRVLTRVSVGGGCEGGECDCDCDEGGGGGEVEEEEYCLKYCLNDIVCQISRVGA